MDPRDLYLCDNCGQPWSVMREVIMDSDVPRYCPGCGAQQLRKIKGLVREAFTAHCFDGLNPKLVEVLYTVWVSEKAKGVKLPDKFVTYLRVQLTEG